MSPRRKRKNKTFKVLHAPLHGNSATNREIHRALNRKGVVSVNITEAYKHVGFLRGRPRWRATSGSRRRNSRGTMVARDVAVLVRRWRKPLSSGVRKGSEASTPLPIAPERFICFSVDNLRGRPVVTIGLHPNAAVRKPGRWRTDRASKYRDYMKETRQVVEQLRAHYGNKLEVVIMGDLQWTAGDPIHKHTPRHLFDKLDMKWISRGLDWVAVSDGLRIVDWDVIPTAINGQDHPWIEVELEFIG